MLTAKFPVYAMRPYISLFEEPPYTVVETRFDRYVLDMPTLEGNYWERRITLLGMDTGYRLYPLKEKFHTIAQILRSKRREFIDSDGKLWKLKKDKYYKCKSYAVLHASTTWTGKKLLSTRAGNFVADDVYKYVTVIETPIGKIVFDYSNEPTTRTRVKI